MIGEKKFIWANRIVLFVLFLVCIFTPAIYDTFTQTDELTIVSNEGYITEYYESLDTSDCEIVVTFNESVYTGNIVVAFYDKDENLLSSESSYFYRDSDDTLYSTFSINGKVDSYEIVDYSDIQIDANNGLVFETCFSIGGIMFIIFIVSLLLSCKTYDYCGNQIIVYAGWYKHFIKINGTKYDEHNTFISFTSIKMSCTIDNNAFVETTISLTNRISTKINGRLVKPIKAGESPVKSEENK